jgi:hypothetical protein
MATRYREHADPATLLDTAYLEALRIELAGYLAKRLQIADPEMTMPGYPRQYCCIAPDATDPCHRSLFSTHLGPAREGGYQSTVITTNYGLVADYTLRALGREGWASPRAFRLQKLSGIRGRISLSDFPSGKADPVVDAGW